MSLHLTKYNIFAFRLFGPAVAHAGLIFGNITADQ